MNSMTDIHGRKIPSLFDLQPRPDVTGMVHRDDPETSRDAAEAVQPHVTVLHLLVLDVISAYGPMTDEALEQLPYFAHYAPSTIRKRRSELYRKGLLVQAGVAVNSRGRRMVIWQLVEPKK